MTFKLRDNVDVEEVESEETIRTPDGGTAQVQKGDKVYRTENGWVYHHPAYDDDDNEIEPDWDEVAKSHSNPALVADLLEEGESSDESEDDQQGGQEADGEPEDTSFPEPAAPRRRGR